MITNLQLGAKLLQKRLKPKENDDMYYGAIVQEGQTAVWCNLNNDYDLLESDIKQLKHLGFVIETDGDISFYFGDEKEICT